MKAQLTSRKKAIEASVQMYQGVESVPEAPAPTFGIREFYPKNRICGFKLGPCQICRSRDEVHLCGQYCIYGLGHAGGKTCCDCVNSVRYRTEKERKLPHLPSHLSLLGSELLPSCGSVTIDLSPGVDDGHVR